MPHRPVGTEEECWQEPETRIATAAEPGNRIRSGVRMMGAEAAGCRPSASGVILRIEGRGAARFKKSRTPVTGTANVLLSFPT